MIQNITNNKNSYPSPKKIPAESLVFFGTQGVGSGKGISVARFNSISGEISKVSLAVETEAPAFLLFHPDGHTAYACNSNNFSCNWFSEKISSFSVDRESGKLTFLNQQNSGGRDPDYLCIDKTNRYILVANYKGGNVTALEILENGSLGNATAFFQHTGAGFNPDRQDQPYAHCVKLDPDNRFALVADLGLDRIYVYRFNESDGTLKPNNPPYFSSQPGYGPRHLIFHPNGRYVYATNEMDCSVSALSWNAETGVLAEIQTVQTLPDDFTANSACGDIGIHSDGKYLFAANRGHNSLTVFSIDSATGKITVIETVPTLGEKPRNIAFDPTEQWLLVSNQTSNNVTIYRFDPSTGHLSPNGAPYKIPNPMGIAFLG
jgi:6-phosphogluconolactonase